MTASAFIPADALRLAVRSAGVRGSGGPTTPKPPIKPQPSGGRLIRIDQEPPPPN